MWQWLWQSDPMDGEGMPLAPIAAMQLHCPVQPADE